MIWIDLIQNRISKQMYTMTITILKKYRTNKGWGVKEETFRKPRIMFPHIHNHVIYFLSFSASPALKNIYMKYEKYIYEKYIY